MTKLTKTTLVLAITGLVVGSIADFSGIKVNSIWDAALPLGAVFLGGFVIFLMMENEMASFDREEAAKSVAPGGLALAPAACQPPVNQVVSGPSGSCTGGCKSCSNAVHGHYA